MLTNGSVKKFSIFDKIFMFILMLFIFFNLIPNNAKSKSCKTMVFSHLSVKLSLKSYCQIAISKTI